MKRFRREEVERHCVGDEWPEFLGEVALGQSFAVETVGCGVNGPIRVTGVQAGDAVAVHVEHIDIEGPFVAGSHGPLGDDWPSVPLEYRDGYFYWPRHFRLKASPSVGNVALLPEPTPEVLALCRECRYFGKRFPNRIGWRRVVRPHRGKLAHQDCWAVAPGAVVHMKSAVDGAGLCVDDVHAYIGQGELGQVGIEVNATVRLRVERSTGWRVDWPLIETEDEIMVFCGWSWLGDDHPRWNYVDVVREAYAALRAVVSAKAHCSEEEANSLVATGANLRNCALYGLGEGLATKRSDALPDDIAVVACLPKDAFVRE